MAEDGYRDIIVDGVSRPDLISDTANLNINIDINGDGKPNTHMDSDGDGKAVAFLSMAGTTYFGLTKKKEKLINH